MISMKDYAKEKGVSYEAIRTQVKRYNEELKDHIIKRNRITYLDDQAVEFLDERRRSNPVVIYEHSKDEEIEELKKELEQARTENKGLLLKIVDLQEQIVKDKEIMISLQEQNKLFLEQKIAEEKKGFFARLFKK